MSPFEGNTITILLILASIDLLLTIISLIKSSTRMKTVGTGALQVISYITIFLFVLAFNLSIIPTCTLVGSVVVCAGYNKIDALLINRGE